jgi:16S rRNA processing protein RimM
VADPEWDAMVLVGVVARPHGVRGDVVLNAETDFIEERFSVGATLWTRMSGVMQRLTVVRASLAGRRPVVGFDGVNDIPGAERLAGAELRITEDLVMPLAPGSYYVHQLVGCHVETTGGEALGEVTRVDGGAGASVLVIVGPRGEVLVPLVESVCQTIDVEARRIRIEALEGLLEVNAPSERSARRRRGRGRATEAPEPGRAP